MLQLIISFHQDEENDWVTVLQCGHFQHVRHDPPFINRPWVTSKEGQDKMNGHQLKCKKCDTNEPKDSHSPSKTANK